MSEILTLMIDFITVATFIGIVVGLVLVLLGRRV